jgi:hypothetical protein
MCTGMALLALAGVASLIQHFGPDGTRSAASMAGVVAGTVACAAIWWIRCPGCRRSVGFWSFKHPLGQFGPADLPSVRQCPYCSFPRTSKSGKS